MTPPVPTPAEKVLARVLLVSIVDGWSIIAVAALGTLLSLAFGDFSGAFVGLLVATAGLIELRGRARLGRRDASGMKLLVRAQMMLLAVILVYCVSRLGSFDEGLVLDNLTPEMEMVLKENGIQRADVVPAVRLLFYAVYGIVAVLSLLFQGGLALYYRSRTARVAEALATPPQSPLA